MALRILIDYPVKRGEYIMGTNTNMILEVYPMDSWGCHSLAVDHLLCALKVPDSNSGISN